MVEAIVGSQAADIMSAELIQRWLKFAAVSEKSIATYSNCLKQLQRYFLSNAISKPTRADLENWRDELISSGKSASTVALYLTAAKLFFRFLAQECLYPNIADNLKNRVRLSHDHKRDALSVDQARELIKATEGKNLLALRDRAITGLLLTTGVRSIEIVRANVADIRYSRGNAFLYVQGKGRFDKSECVLIPASVMKPLQAYLKARGKFSANEPLFISLSRRNYGKRLETQSVRKMIKSNLRKIGIDAPTVTCHSLRHTAACIMFEAKVALTDIQMVLRHKSVDTTLIYLNTINRQKNLAENIVAQFLRI